MSNTDKLREIAAKWKLTQADLEIWKAERRIVQTPIPEFLSDLTALLEQHKEAILAGMYPKDFLLWFHDNAQIESREETFLVYNEMRFYTLDEVFDFWERVQEKNKYIARQDNLKNVKK